MLNFIPIPMLYDLSTMSIYGTLPRRKHSCPENNSNFNGSRGQFHQNKIQPFSTTLSCTSLNLQPNSPHHSSKRRGARRRIHKKNQNFMSSRSSSSGIYSASSNVSENGITSPSILSSETTSSAASSTDFSETISPDDEAFLFEELQNLRINENQSNGSFSFR